MLEIQISMLEISRSTTGVNNTVNVSIKMPFFYQVVARHQYSSFFHYACLICVIFFVGCNLVFVF